MTYTKRYQLGGIDRRPESALNDPQTAKVRCNLIKDASGRNVCRPGYEIKLIGGQDTDVMGLGPICGITNYARNDYATEGRVEELCIFNSTLQTLVLYEGYVEPIGSHPLEKRPTSSVGSQERWEIDAGTYSYSILAAGESGATTIQSLSDMITAQEGGTNYIDGVPALAANYPAACAFERHDLAIESKYRLALFAPRNASFYYLGRVDPTDLSVTHIGATNDSFDDAAAGYNSDFPMLVPSIVLRNVLYFIDSCRLMKYDGENVTYAGIANKIVDSDVSLSTESTGLLTSGTYNYTITYSRTDNQGYTIESDPYYTANINVGTSQKVVLSLLNASTRWIPEITYGAEYGWEDPLIYGAWGARTNGVQSATTLLYCDGGITIGSYTMNNLDLGDTVYLYDHATSAYVERKITGRTNSYIQFLSPVTVADNEAISPNVHLNLYRSKVGPSSLNYAIAKIPYDMGATIYRDSAADTSLSVPYYAPVVSHAPYPQRRDSTRRITALGSYRNLLLVGDRNRVIYSDIDDPEYFPPDNFIEISAADNEEIRAFFTQENSFYVFLDRSIYVVTGDLSSAQYNVDIISRSIGTISPSSIIEIDRLCYFSNEEGVFTLEQGGYPTLLSEPIADLWQSAWKESFSAPCRAIAFHDIENSLYVVGTFSKHITATGLLRAFAYNYIRKEWYEYADFPFSRGAVNYKGTTYLGHWDFFTQSLVSRMLRRRYSDPVCRYTNRDDATPIAWAYESNKEDMGDWSTYKKALRLALNMKREVISNPLTLNTRTPSAFSYTATMEGAVLTATGYATAAGSVPSFHKIAEGKFKDLSFRLDALNTNYTENTEPVINFVDIEYEEPYDKKIKK